MVRETSENESGHHLSLGTSMTPASSRERASPAKSTAPHLAAEDIEELRVAIERSLCEGELRSPPNSDIDEDLHKSLCIACAKARLQRVRAEQLLIDLKQIWMSLPSMLSTRTGERLNEVVTACIDEYYA
jgi:hypothetical protein